MEAEDINSISFTTEKSGKKKYPVNRGNPDANLVQRSNMQQTLNNKMDDIRQTENDEVENLEKYANGTKTIRDIAIEKSMSQRINAPNMANMPNMPNVDKQLGGENDLEYLNSYNSAQYGASQLKKYEEDFYKIYEQAREYGQQIRSLQNNNLENIDEYPNYDDDDDEYPNYDDDIEDWPENQDGGEDKPKRELPPRLKLMQQMAKKMRDSGKYPGLVQVNFMSIAKLMIDDIIREKKTDDINKISDDAMKLVITKADEYIKRFRDAPPKIKPIKKSKITQSNDRSNNRGNLHNSRDRERQEYPNNEENAISNGRKNNRTKSNSSKKSSKSNQYGGECSMPSIKIKDQIAMQRRFY